MSKDKGQTMVEFALILPVLLLAIFIIIESARILQAYITVQHAAREGARYAITGRWEEEFEGTPDREGGPRVASIKAVARNALAGLAIDDSEPRYDAADKIRTGHYEIKVQCTTSGGLKDNCAGDPNQEVAVQVAYRLEIITPVLNVIAPSVQVVGHVTMINEAFGQIGGGGFAGLREPPTPIVETFTPGPSPTFTPTPTGTNTPTPTETSVPTETPTVTSTPACEVRIKKPVWPADTYVEVTGDPGDTIILRDMNAGGAEIGRGVVGAGGYCNGSVRIGASGLLVRGHIIGAISTTHTSSDTACVGDTACWPTSTPTATPTVTPTPTSTPTEPYIVLSHACIPEGQPTNMTVYGYNWLANPNKEIQILWDGSLKDHFASRVNWTYALRISASEATSGTHTVTALIDSPRTEDSRNVVVPCPPEPTPTITATPLRPDLRITGIVGPSSPITAYVPITFAVGIRNDGQGDALNLFWVDLYDLPEGSDPPTAGQSQGDAAWTAVSSLGAGDTETVILYYFFTVSGTREVYGYVDTRQNVEEIDEGNNAWGRLDLNITAGTVLTATLTTDPVCSAAGVSTTITVRGQGWPDTGNIQILYDGTPKGDPFPSQASWSRVITISGPSETDERPHAILAVIPGRPSMQADYYIPCSAMGTIDGYTWVFIKGDVVPHGRTDVSCRDADREIAQTTSDDDAYYVMRVPPGVSYTVIGKTYIDGILYRDTATVPLVGAGSTIRVNLILIPQY